MVHFLSFEQIGIPSVLVYSGWRIPQISADVVDKACTYLMNHIYQDFDEMELIAGPHAWDIDYISSMVVVTVSDTAKPKNFTLH